MRKAVRLKVMLQIEGEDAPADDFAKSASQAVRDILAAGHWRHPLLAVTVQNITEDEANDADDAQKAAPPPAKAAG